MRDFSTKIDNTAPAASGILKAAEDNVRFEELEQAVKTANISLDPADGPDTDKKMLAQAVARYASGAQWAQDQGVKNAYVLKTTGQWVVPKTLFSGMWVRWVPGATNDAACVANVFGLGNKSILDWLGAELGQGAITQNRPTEMFFSPTSDAWILVPWADARNVSGDATTDPGGDPSTDTMLVAMGGDTLANVSSVNLDPNTLGALDGDLMVVITKIGEQSQEANLNDTTIPAGWTEHFRQIMASGDEYDFEVVAAYMVFSGAPPSDIEFALPPNSEVAYSWFIIRNATVVETASSYQPSVEGTGLVTFNVTRDISQEMVLVTALTSYTKDSVGGAEGASFDGLQQTGRDASPNLRQMSLFGMTTAEGVSTVEYTTTEVERFDTKVVWIPISKT